MCVCVFLIFKALPFSFAGIHHSRCLLFWTCTQTVKDGSCCVAMTTGHLKKNKKNEKGQCDDNPHPGSHTGCVGDKDTKASQTHMQYIECVPVFVADITCILQVRPCCLYSKRNKEEMNERSEET